MSSPIRNRRRAVVAGVTAVVLTAAMATTAAGNADPPAADHQLSRPEIDQAADRLGPAGRVILTGVERAARAEIASAEREGRISPAQRRGLEECLERGDCGGVDTERGLDLVVDRVVTDVVEGVVEPVLEALLGE